MEVHRLGGVEVLIGRLGSCIALSGKELIRLFRGESKLVALLLGAEPEVTVLAISNNVVAGWILVRLLESEVALKFISVVGHVDGTVGRVSVVVCCVKRAGVVLTKGQ